MRAVTLLCALLLAGPASAYVRTRTDAGDPVHWEANCVYVQPDSAGTADLPPDQVFPAIERAMNNWQTATSGIAYLKLIYEQPAPLDAHLDGFNIIKFRADRWCHPNDKEHTDVCYSAAAAGITTVFHAKTGGHAGAILDADIELNTLNFKFAILQPGAPLPPSDGRDVIDLENTLTHELGHLQGLDHTCRDSANGVNEPDETGQLPPLCTAVSSLPAAERDKITGATMYNTAGPGEISKRKPSADDVAGIAAAYPLANDPNRCARVNLADFAGKSGCAIGAANGAPRGSAALLLLLAGGCWLRRGRGRRGAFARSAAPPRRA